MADATIVDLLGSDILLHHDSSDTSTLWADTAETTPATDGGTVLSWSRQSSASLDLSYFVAANGPTYRADYNSTGYPGLQFNGTTNLLRTPGTGLSAGQKLYSLCVSTFISGTTVWNRGGGTGYLRQYGGNLLQSGVSSGSGPTSTSRICCASVAGPNQTEFHSLTGNAGQDWLLSTLGTPIVLGAFEGSLNSFSQYGAVVIHEILFIASTSEWGQVLRAAKVLRDKWGQTDPSSVPQATGGGASFPLIGPGGLVY
jgi:hypothetical protein